MRYSVHVPVLVTKLWFKLCTDLHTGVSLQRLADEGHGLFAAVKSAALVSLGELHRLGVTWS